MITLLSLPEGLEASGLEVWVGTWFGAGLVEPLRAGLAVASVVALLAILPRMSRGFWLAAAVSVAVAGGFASNLWDTATGIADSRLIVIDEVAGFLTVLGIVGGVGTVFGAAAALVFLGLDRWKPWPFDLVETIPGGLGVMLDDMVIGFALGMALLVARQLARGRKGNLALKD